MSTRSSFKPVIAGMLALMAVQVARADENITFVSQGTTLAGTLVFPRDTPPIATLVLIHGSGPAERMLWLARPFAVRGFAVLTYDKRGVGQSGGVYGGNTMSPANIELLAADAAAALDVAVKDSRLQNIPAGFGGISQAGWIAPLAALKSKNVKFMALFSGPVTTVSEEDHFSKYAESDPDFWKTHTLRQVRDHMKTAQPWAEDVDPRDSIRKISIPALWLFGDQDKSIPVDLSFSRLDDLIRNGQKNLSYTVFPGYGHELVNRFNDPAFDEMAKWIATIALKY